MKATFKISILIIFFFTVCQALSQTWPKYYSQNNQYDFPGDIIETYDKGYLIGGNFGNNFGQIFKQWSWLIKTDINGNLLWDKVISAEEEYVITNAIEQTAEGGILTCGAIFSYSAGKWYPYVMKLNVCGEKEWCKIYTGTNSLSTWAQDILELPSGDIVVMVNQWEENEAVHLFKLNEQGELLWINAYCKGSDYPQSDAPFGSSLNLTRENNLLIVGDVYWENPWGPSGIVYLRPFFALIEYTGIEKWVLPFGLNDTLLGQAHHVIELSNGNFIGVGRYTEISYGLKGLFMNFDKNGNEINYKVFDFNQLNQNYNIGLFYDIIQLDSVYVLASYFGNSQWENPAPPGEVIIDTSVFLNIYNYRQYLNNNEPYHLKKVFSNKLVNSSVYQQSNNWDIFLTKLNPGLEYDSLYTGNYAYDSLCTTGPPQSGIINLSECDIVVGIDAPTPGQYNESLKTISINAFPNPAKDKVKFEFENTEYHQNIQFHCYDLLGNLICSKPVLKGQKGVAIDISSWPPGMYVAIVSSNGSAVGKCKFVVEIRK